MKKKKEFEIYLNKKFTCDYTVQQHIGNVTYFNDWLKTNSMFDIIRTTASVILLYVKYLQAVPIKTGTINTRLNSLRKYFDCMIKLGYIARNPSLTIHVKGRENKVVENPLSSDTLNNLHQQFELFLDAKPKPINIKSEADTFSKQRKKLILSLMIYQGLDTGELNNLCVTDFNANKGTIYIASKNRRNSRVLNLEPFQILPFLEYLKFLPATQEKVFTIRISDFMTFILSCIKGIEPQVRNAEHIRQSRIMIWVSTLNLREAQYRIGHKFVSSTEQYLQQNTTELVEEINTLHLFR